MYFVKWWETEHHTLCSWLARPMLADWVFYRLYILIFQFKFKAEVHDEAVRVLLFSKWNYCRNVLFSKKWNPLHNIFNLWFLIFLVSSLQIRSCYQKLLKFFGCAWRVFFSLASGETPHFSLGSQAEKFGNPFDRQMVLPAFCLPLTNVLCALSQTDDMTWIQRIQEMFHLVCQVHDLEGR